MIEQLRAEIEQRLQASHPRIIISALDRLLMEAVEDEKCSYHHHFKVYRTLRSRITYFTRRTDKKEREINTALSTIADKIADIRESRYERVCLECEACKTRHKPWPAHTKFLVPHAVLDAMAVLMN